MKRIEATPRAVSNDFIFKRGSLNEKRVDAEKWFTARSQFRSELALLNLAKGVDIPLKKVKGSCKKSY